MSRDFILRSNVCQWMHYITSKYTQTKEAWNNKCKEKMSDTILSLQGTDLRYFVWQVKAPTADQKYRPDSNTSHPGQARVERTLAYQTASVAATEPQQPVRIRNMFATIAEPKWSISMWNVFAPTLGCNAPPGQRAGHGILTWHGALLLDRWVHLRKAWWILVWVFACRRRLAGSPGILQIHDFGIHWYILFQCEASFVAVGLQSLACSMEILPPRRQRS